jgi:hypothetical protein
MKKIPFDEDFFIHDNEKSFYWAGFLAARGSFGDKIYVSNKNKSVIKLFMAHIKCFGKKLRSKNNCYTLELRSVKVKTDLNRFGITKNKLNFNIPVNMQNHGFINHFIRGYFDGRGSYSFQNKKSKVVEIPGNKSLIQSFHKIITSNISIKTIAKPSKSYKKPTNNCYRIRYTGSNLLKEISGFVYKNATIYNKIKVF